MQLVVVIPAYNEERTVGEVVKKCKMQNAKCKIIVIDDGSYDRTAEVARAAGATVLRHPLNRGLGAALATGIEAALRTLHALRCTLYAAIIVTLDADGQHDPAEIPRLIEPIIKGEAEVVIGTRFHNKSLALSSLTKLSFDQSSTIPPLKVRGGRSDTFIHKIIMQSDSDFTSEGSYEIPYTRRLANFCGNIATWLLFGLWVSDSQSGFRAFSGVAAERLRLRTSTMEVSSEIIREIARLRLRWVEVPITAHYTSYSLSKGQGFFRGLETLWKLIILKFFR